MAKIGEVNEVELARWLEERPDSIRAMVASHPPGRLYQHKPTKQRVVILGYSEDRTVRMAVTGVFNFISHERGVFGVPIDELEECELPPLGTLCGAVLTNEELAAALRTAEATTAGRVAAVEQAATKKLEAGWTPRPWDGVR